MTNNKEEIKQTVISVEESRLVQLKVIGYDLQKQKESISKKIIQNDDLVETAYIIFKQSQAKGQPLPEELTTPPVGKGKEDKTKKEGK